MCHTQYSESLIPLSLEAENKTRETKMERQQERQLENALLDPDDSSNISTLPGLWLPIILECHCMSGKGRYTSHLITAQSE